MKGDQDYNMSPVSFQEPRALQQHQPDSLEEDVQFISSLNNSMKNKKKKDKRKKKDLMVEASPWGDENPLQYKEEQVTAMRSNSSAKSGSKKEKKKKAAIESNENRPPQKRTSARNTRQIAKPFKSTVTVKKSQKKRQKSSPEIRFSDGSPSSIEFQGTSPAISGGKTPKNSNVETHQDPKCKETLRKNDGNSQQRFQQALSCNLGPYSSTPLSSPTLPFWTKKKVKLNDLGKTKDVKGLSDHSQDLFITQKKFVLSHGSSDDSPPLGQEQFLSQPSCLSRSSLDHSSAGNSQQVVLRETATQTDDHFSYCSLMNFVKRVKVLETCSEEPLDLSLPTRIRAQKDVSNPSNIIMVSSQSPHVSPKWAKRRKLNFSFTPVEKVEDKKFIQTTLNTSYFFKGKGEPGESTPITPLLKIKEKPKNKSRKSNVHAKKRPKQHDQN